MNAFCLFQAHFNFLGSPAHSKRSLFFAIIFFLKFLRDRATSNSLAFYHEKGADEVSSHYDKVQNDLHSLGKNLKESVKVERRMKGELTGHEDELRRQK